MARYNKPPFLFEPWGDIQNASGLSFSQALLRDAPAEKFLILPYGFPLIGTRVNPSDSSQLQPVSISAIKTTGGEYGAVVVPRPSLGTFSTQTNVSLTGGASDALHTVAAADKYIYIGLQTAGIDLYFGIGAAAENVKGYLVTGKGSSIIFGDGGIPMPAAGTIIYGWGTGAGVVSKQVVQ